VRRAAAGEQAAWEQLVTTYSPLLWGIARSYRLAASDAADAVQTTWLRLVEHLADIRRPEAVGAWLATTLRRECILTRKRTDRQPPMDIAAMEISDESAAVERQIIRQEEKAALENAMQLLSDRQRVLLRMLAATPPPSYEEVAAALDIPVGSIGPTKGRALRRLRRLLDSGHAG
jgi:RNA polymerase sigma factor (sigma-70 family)